MKTFRITCTTGETFEITIPRPAEHSSFFIFTLPKSGSTLLDNMMIEACKLVGMPVIAPGYLAFNHGIEEHTIDRSLEDIFFQSGYAYLGFRNFLPFKPSFDFSTVRTILLIRDPRDMLTSLYFSLKYSHTLPTKGGTKTENLTKTRRDMQFLDIDKFVVTRATSYRKIIDQYHAALSPDQLKVYRYEDVIFRKQEWLVDMLNYLELPLDSLKITEIATRHDVFPSAEDPHSHIRQVIPGNYKKHLKPSTIEQLNSFFSDFLLEYGYSF